jgi:hypothetical protein
MSTPHDIQEPRPTLEFQCREEGTFKPSRPAVPWAMRLGGAVRQKPDGLSWEGGEGRSHPPIPQVLTGPLSQDQIDQNNEYMTRTW